jgi:hypothetical protein
LGGGAAGTNQYMSLIAGTAAGSPDPAASEKVLVEGLGWAVVGLAAALPE